MSLQRGLVCGLAAALLFACNTYVPDLSVEETQGKTTVSFALLGEYPTGVNRVRLSKAGTRIWEIEAEDGKPQLWELRFVEGRNPVLPEGIAHGSFVLRHPPESEDFILESGVSYLLEIWSTDDLKSQEEFSIRPARP